MSKQSITYGGMKKPQMWLLTSKLMDARTWRQIADAEHVGGDAVRSIMEPNAPMSKTPGERC
jgi:hypothetical protein